jgi:hypothetical protein
MKSIKSNFLLSLLLFVVLIVISYISYRIEVLSSNSIKGVWQWILIQPLLYIPIGVSLAIPSFIQNFKLNGNWRIDNNRLLFFGIPSLFLTFLYPIHFYTFIDLPTLVVSGEKLPILSAMIFGYILLTSFYKREEN